MLECLDVPKKRRGIPVVRQRANFRVLLLLQNSDGYDTARMRKTRKLHAVALIKAQQSDFVKERIA
jgi:hypothetical protein